MQDWSNPYSRAVQWQIIGEEIRKIYQSMYDRHAGDYVAMVGAIRETDRRMRRGVTARERKLIRGGLLKRSESRKLDALGAYFVIVQLNSLVQEYPFPGMESLELVVHKKEQVEKAVESINAAAYVETDAVRNERPRIVLKVDSFGSIGAPEFYRDIVSRKTEVSIDARDVYGFVGYARLYVAHEYAHILEIMLEKCLPEVHEATIRTIEAYLEENCGSADFDDDAVKGFISMQLRLYSAKSMRELIAESFAASELLAVPPPLAQDVTAIVMPGFKLLSTVRDIRMGLVDPEQLEIGIEILPETEQRDLAEAML